MWYYAGQCRLLVGVAMRMIVKTDTGRLASLSPADDAGEFRMSMLDGDPWTLLQYHGAITAAECEAADRHAALWAACRFVSERASSFEPRSPSSKSELADRMGEREMDAWRRFEKAQASMPVFVRAEVMGVCCYQQQPSNLRHLRVGLSALVRHYRISWLPDH